MSRLACQSHITDREGAMSVSTTAITIALSVVLVTPISADAQFELSETATVKTDIPQKRLETRNAAFIPPVGRLAIQHIRFSAAQASTPRRRGWIARHPVFFGALVGFGTGFLIGYLPGDDGVFNDFTAGFNGWVTGGIGAGAGAAVGAMVAATSD
jgi:hypothetical protein